MIDLPVISIRRSDLESLLGRRLEIPEIYRLFTKLKCEIESIENDTITYEANSDRPDLFSVEGVSRAIKPWLNIEWRRYSIVESDIQAYARVINRRPYVALAVVRDVELSDEAVSQIMQLQEKIAQTHGRMRRKISIGVYDLDYVKPPIYYDLVDPDSVEMKPLNHDRAMKLREVLNNTEQGVLYGYIIRDMEKYPVLRDKEHNILSLVPIINSDHCKVTTSTRNILIDATGTSVNDVVNAVTIMATSISERSRTGRIESITVVYENSFAVKAPRTDQPEISVRIEDVNRLLGVDLSLTRLLELLNYFYYEIVRYDDSTVVVKPPIYRIDVSSWVDVAEDIAIAVGYEVIGELANSLPSTQTTGRIHPLEYISRRIRHLLIGLGFQEVANYMMTSRSIQLDMLGSKNDMFIVENPRTERFEGLRIWLTPQLVDVVVENSEKYSKIMIFEIGDVAIPDTSYETQARIERRLGIAISHDKATLTDGLAYISALLRELKVEPTFRKGNMPGFLPERTSMIIGCGDVELGFIGEIDPRILYRMGARNPVVVGEINLNKILEHCRI